MLKQQIRSFANESFDQNVDQIVRERLVKFSDKSYEKLYDHL